MQKTGSIIMIILSIMALLIPGVRRFVFRRLLKNKHIRNMGLQLILAIPFLRDKMMKQIFPARAEMSSGNMG